MRVFFLLPFAIFFLFSCRSEKKQRELLEIPIDIDQDNSIRLSEITEELTAIELEFTENSLINPDQTVRVIVSENEIITVEYHKILVFNREGKFIRSIGSRGQGPGEHNMIMNGAFDEKKKQLFIRSSPGKIICYDLNGKFIKQSNTPPIQSSLGVFINCIDYVNDKLLLVIELKDRKTNGMDIHSLVYQLDNDFRIIDSCFIHNIHLEPNIFTSSLVVDKILKVNTHTYLYHGDLFEKEEGSAKRAPRDTLFRYEDNKLIPELKLKFRNDKIIDNIILYNLYRSSRYIFSWYNNRNDKNNYSFCYDLKTERGYNMKNGYTDDINNIENRVRIRPLNSNGELFYYFYTHMKPDEDIEPNPTLYIGKLKK